MEGQRLEQSLMEALLNATRAFSHTRPAKEVSPGDFYVLFHIGWRCRHRQMEVEGIRVSDLSRSVRRSRPALTRAINELETRGLVARHAARTDRREVYVSLTDDGEQMLQKAQDEMHGFAKTILEGLGEQDAQELTRLLNKLTDVIAESGYCAPRGRRKDWSEIPRD